MPDKILFSLSKVCKSYQEGSQTRSVLNNINAEFRQGELIVIQGRSGSGKSTLLNLLAGIDLPDSGEVKIDGVAINHLDEQARTLYRRHNIGFVFQDYNLIPTLTVAENLLFPLELNGINGEQAKISVANLLSGISLEDRMESFPDQLSGGEQQRIAIARAVVHKPAIVLADEPTGNLDLDTERQILELLSELPREHKVTFICATHSTEVAAIADVIYQLEQGQLQL